VQGADVVKFLQGQLSNDVACATPERAVLAGLHNPQGRTVALLRLALAAPDEILALVPRELAGTVAARLAKFILRAKVKVADVSGDWAITGVQLSDISDVTVATVGAARRDQEGRLWLCVASDVRNAGESHTVPTSRWLVASGVTAHQIHSAGTNAALAAGGSPPSPLTPDEWHALDIAAGIPQVYAATSEAFVAQMLNLDLVDGIAFDKGCYTGQEVIARAHYRGRVKRRMQRFRSLEHTALKPGDAGTLSDGRSFKVVDAIQLSDGRSEFLAVTTFGSAGDESSDGSAGAAMNAEQLPLPYTLPD
jgi:hypothetical protein